MDIRSYKGLVDESIKVFLDSKMDVLSGYNLPERVKKIIEYSYEFILAGGKRIRPYLVYLSYMAFGGDDTDDIVRYSRAFELLHNFALIHDDIIDKGTKRHGVWTYHKFGETLFGHENASHLGVSQGILAGDLVFSWAYEINFDNYNFNYQNLIKAQRNFITMFEEVLYGQMLDVDLMAGDRVDSDTILQKNYLKTSSYSFIRPLKAGAMLAGADSEILYDLKTFGSFLGQAFQIRDDLQDIILEEEATGKTSFSDIQDGQQTIFVDYIMNSGDQSDIEFLKDCMGKTLDKYQKQELRNIFVNTGAIKYGEDLINKNLDGARDSLSKLKFGNNDMKQYFDQIISMIAKIG